MLHIHKMSVSQNIGVNIFLFILNNLTTNKCFTILLLTELDTRFYARVNIKVLLTQVITEIIRL